MLQSTLALVLGVLLMSTASGLVLWFISQGFKAIRSQAVGWTVAESAVTSLIAVFGYASKLLANPDKAPDPNEK